MRQLSCMDLKRRVKGMKRQPAATPQAAPGKMKRMVATKTLTMIQKAKMMQGTMIRLPSRAEPKAQQPGAP